ncbi:MAG: transposase [Sulfitobacter dubius]|uniref:transposase n=1 Tax=Alphaproteobacteria TaxID=28211 RepID=UPI000564B160|nr:transposase [Sulfitobacter sp. EhC04]OAN70282.1 transposase [Sulfitobacter sp. EhC04]
MGATSEFLTPVPRRSDGKREWPLDLKARVVAETLIAGETVKGVAGRYDLIPSTVSDWRRMARQGKLVLPNLDGMGFVPVEIEEAAVPAEAPVGAGRSGTLDIVKGDVVIRLDASTPAGRIAEIVMAL